MTVSVTNFNQYDEVFLKSKRRLTINFTLAKLSNNNKLLLNYTFSMLDNSLVFDDKILMRRDAR